MSDSAGDRLTWFLAGLGAVFFGSLFVTRGIGAFDFWWWISANVVVLVCLTALVDPGWRRQIKEDLAGSILFKTVVGAASAVLLYAVFFAGNTLLRTVFASGGRGIDGVYAFKAGASPLRIVALMTLIIGPGEELFWRGFLQRRLQLSLGRWRGFLAACGVYTLIHVGSLNPVLVLAAFVCSLFWGFLYLRYGSLLLIVISHTLWDLMVFVLVPFTAGTAS